MNHPAPTPCKIRSVIPAASAGMTAVGERGHDEKEGVGMAEPWNATTL